MLTNLVSTQNRIKRYERTSVFNTVSFGSRATDRQSKVSTIVTPIQPDAPSTRTASPSANSHAAASMNVCTVQYNSLPPAAVAEYPLERAPDGMFKWVQILGDSQTYEVNYFNSELKRIIPLGRYLDPATASLAHSLARHREECRCSNFSAQDVIQKWFASSVENQVDESLPMPVNNQNDVVPMEKDDLILGRDIDELLSDLI